MTGLAKERFASTSEENTGSSKGRITYCSTRMRNRERKEKTEIQGTFNVTCTPSFPDTRSESHLFVSISYPFVSIRIDSIGQSEKCISTRSLIVDSARVRLFRNSKSCASPHDWAPSGFQKTLILGIYTSPSRRNIDAH